MCSDLFGADKSRDGGSWRPFATETCGRVRERECVWCRSLVVVASLNCGFQGGSCVQVSM